MSCASCRRANLFFRCPPLFELERVTNTGVAFSLFSSRQGIVVLLPAALMLLLCVYQAREKTLSTPARLAISGLIGGGLGNLVDRILFGGVTDYIRLSLIRFPIFNFADICITVSVAALMLLLLLTISTTRRRNVMGESENIELIVDPSLSGMRLDAYLREQTPFSRSRIASLMEEGALFVNGEVERKAARKTEGGMRLLLVVPEAQPVDIVPQNIPLDILYQDADVVVVNKKSGMVVHPPRETKAARWSMPCSIRPRFIRHRGRNAARNRPSAGQRHLRPDFDCEKRCGSRLAQRAIQGANDGKSITAPLRTVPFQG